MGDRMHNRALGRGVISGSRSPEIEYPLPHKLFSNGDLISDEFLI